MTGRFGRFGRFEQFVREPQFISNVSPRTVWRYRESFKWLDEDLNDSGRIEVARHSHRGNKDSSLRVATTVFGR